MTIVLGDLETGGALRLDIPTLVDSRALVTGNSGAGKSRLLRRLAEQAFGQVQQIIIDPEGEFATLRERHDFLLAGKGGEVPAEPRAAALLARRLIELRASAILDLYDLKLDEQRAFVRVFLESLLEMPRDQYRPVLILIDEAHRFAPEDGDSQSRDAVVSLMSQGRKRGLCGIPATQRLSKLSKDAAAEAANGFIGRTTLDTDQKRAADALGLSSKDERVALRDLENGVFHAYGPALNQKGVVLFRGGDVETTHPKAGQRHKVEPPAPPDAIRKLADELKDLPAQAAEEIRTLQAAKARVREVEGQLRAALKAQPPAPPAPKAPRTIEKPVLKDAQVKRLEDVTDLTNQLYGAWGAAMDKLQRDIAAGATAHLDRFRREAQEIKAALAAARDQRTLGGRAVAPPAVGPPTSPARPAPVVSHAPSAPRRAESSNGLGMGERAVLTAVAQHQDGVTREQLSILTGYKRSSRDTYLQRLRAGGYVDDQAGRLVATTEGLRVLGADFEPLPTGDALREHWRARLPEGERRVFEVVVSAYPQALERAALDDATGYRRSSRDTYLQRLSARRLVVPVGRGAVRAAEELFG